MIWLLAPTPKHEAAKPMKSERVQNLQIYRKTIFVEVSIGNSNIVFKVFLKT